MNWQGKTVHVVSLGDGDNSTLKTATIHALNSADVLFGAEHHFVSIADCLDPQREPLQLPFPSPFNQFYRVLQQYADQQIVVLASGDALFYGVGNYLLNTVGHQHLTFYPHISAMQYAFHRVGQVWHDAVVHSLHGRPLSTLRLHLQTGNKLGLFTDTNSNPVMIAQLLCDEGFHASTIWVCEALGKDEEKVSSFSAKSLSVATQVFHGLTICIIHCKGYNPRLQQVPGIQDNCFITGSKPGHGMISKREVRLTILSLMQAQKYETAWDIGAGCGSVAIEWARSNPTGQIYAIENHPDRMRHLIENNERFGTRMNMTPVEGTAPDCCASLPQADVIFIGGNGGHLQTLLDYSWHSLNDNGKLIASAVTKDSIETVLQFAESKIGYQGEVVTLQIDKTDNLTHARQLHTYKPITLIKIIKQVKPI